MRTLVRPALLGLALVVVFARAALAQPSARDERAAGASSTDRPAAGPPTGNRRNVTDAVPCSGCHSTTAWRMKDTSGDAVTFDHATTGFPLTGEHVHAPCAACHDASRAIKRACASCHEDPHRGRLMRSCDSCHSPAGWNVTRPLEIHRMTRFPLTGMHVLADCSECHVRANEHRWTDAPIDCFACHEKDYRRPGIEPVHVGTATSPPFPRDCSLCHRAIAWVPAGATATSSSPLASAVNGLRAAPAGHDLRFPIAFGVHRGAACDDCHASNNVARAVRCIGCHAHDLARLMQQHRQPIATDGASCLTCHPGGTRR